MQCMVMFLTSFAAAELLASLFSTSSAEVSRLLVVLRELGSRELSSGSVITASCSVSRTVSSTRTIGLVLVEKIAFACISNDALLIIN